MLGGPEHAPTVDECMHLLGKPDENAVINLLGLKLNDRPGFFMSLFARIRDLRAKTGRPHWLIVDEAHHVMPAHWQPTDSSAAAARGVLMVSVTPSLIAESALRGLDTLIVLGEKPREMLREFADANRIAVDGGRAEERRTARRWSGTRPQKRRRRWSSSSRAARNVADTCASTPKASCRKIAASISADRREN